MKHYKNLENMYFSVPKNKITYPDVAIEIIKRQSHFISY
jgi:hypothetical protein